MKQIILADFFLNNKNIIVTEDFKKFLVPLKELVTPQSPNQVFLIEALNDKEIIFSLADEISRDPNEVIEEIVSIISSNEGADGSTHLWYTEEKVAGIYFCNKRWYCGTTTASSGSRWKARTKVSICRMA